MEPVDVVIVGARCAGSCAAASLARRGRSVLVLDKARFPSDTISSHTMFAPSIDELGLMGALPAVLALGPPPLTTWRLEFDDGHGPKGFHHESFPASDADRVGISVPRMLLDKVLVDTARAAGAQVGEGCTVTRVLWRGGRAAGVEYLDAAGVRQTVTAKLVLGADGQYSTVAELVGAAAPYRYSHCDRCAVYRYYTDPATEDPDATTVYFWRSGTSMGFGFPTTPRGKIIVMFIADDSELPLARSDPEAYWAAKLDEHPEVKERMAGATDATAVRITDDLSSYFRNASGPGWGLIGDAGHFKNPIIGQGIRDALWSARTLCEHVDAVLDDPAGLDRALRRWEQAREQECLPAYLAGIYEGRLEPDAMSVTALVQALIRREVPLVRALAARDGRIREVLTPSVVLGGVVDALRHAERPGAVVRDLMAQGRLVARLARIARRPDFRDTRPMLDLECVRGGWPRAVTPVGARRASTATADAPIGAAAVPERVR